MIRKQSESYFVSDHSNVIPADRVAVCECFGLTSGAASVAKFIVVCVAFGLIGNR